MGELIDDMRRGIDEALACQVSYAAKDKDGHVNCVDGDVDTLEMARDVIVFLGENRWGFMR